MKKYLVKEMFGPTIQGEGSEVGTVVSFLRFAGCNSWNGKAEDKASSGCPFCDTDFVGGERMTKEDILIKLESFNCRKVVVSGGEPLLQFDFDLAHYLMTNGYYISIETNGSRKMSEQLIECVDHITMSPKQSPDKTILNHADDLKILYPAIGKFLTPNDFKDFDCANKYIQPVMDENYKENLSLAILFLQNNPSWKLSLQVHKIIGIE